MSIKGEVKEATGFIKEEANEHGKSPKSQEKAQEGRGLRNEGRAEDGKAPQNHKTWDGPSGEIGIPPAAAAFRERGFALKD
jgi:hypothetical protein